MLTRSAVRVATVDSGTELSRSISTSDDASGFRKVISLRVMASHIRELPDLPFQLRTFSDDIDFQTFREFKNRADDLCPFARGAEASYEGPVDFECIDWKTVQVVER